MNNFKIDDDQEFIENDGVWTHHKKGITYNEIPNSLFKYYSMNEYNLDAIKNGYFFLSNPKEFNDPFDCSRNFIIENRKDFIDGEYVPCLNNVKNIGISCFTENDLNPLMWGHYTKSYQGFTIKIKSKFEILNKENVNDKKIIKVIYSNNPNPINKAHPLSRDYQFIMKLKDWEYENELRLIVERKNNLNKVFYNKADIEEFCFGYNFLEYNNQLKNKLLKIIEEEYPNIPIYSVGPDAKEFKLNKVKLVKGTVQDGLDFIEKRFKKLFN
ncbi:MAG: DUF2971 domain-containing protein [Bacteroidota bacterium]